MIIEGSHEGKGKPCTAIPTPLPPSGFLAFQDRTGVDRRRKQLTGKSKKSGGGVKMADEKSKRLAEGSKREFLEKSRSLRAQSSYPTDF